MTGQDDPDDPREQRPEPDAPSGFPEPPGRDPGRLPPEEPPHHALNTPVGEPDPSEWPDPYEQREDPRGPADGQMVPGEGDPGAAQGDTSDSAPHPDVDVGIRETDVRDRDALDD